MLLRAVTVIIIIFWLGSIGWLCAVVWAPPGSRMMEVDPREVYDVFFSWNDQIDMTLIENGERRGQLTVSGGSGEDIATGVFSNELSVSGSIEDFRTAETAATANLFWKGLVRFDREMELVAGDLSVRVPRQQLIAQLSFEGEPRQIRARATLGDAEIFRFDGAADGEAGTLPMQMLPMGSMLGAGNFDLASLAWESEASMGTFKFEGRTMRAYLLTMRLPDQGQEFRLFLSEAGEPLRVETDLGFEAVSEILVPMETYRQRAAKE